MIRSRAGRPPGVVARAQWIRGAREPRGAMRAASTQGGPLLDRAQNDAIKPLTRRKLAQRVSPDVGTSPGARASCPRSDAHQSASRSSPAKLSHYRRRTSVVPLARARPQAGGKRCSPSSEWRHPVVARQVGSELIFRARVESPQVFVGLHPANDSGPEVSIAALRPDQVQAVAAAAMGVNQRPARPFDQSGAGFGSRASAKRQRCGQPDQATCTAMRWHALFR